MEEIRTPRKRRSKNTELYEKLANLSEGQTHTEVVMGKAEAETLRRTALIYLTRTSPDKYTTSVVDTEQPDKFEVRFFNYPKTEKELA